MCMSFVFIRTRSRTVFQIIYEKERIYIYIITQYTESVEMQMHFIS